MNEQQVPMPVLRKKDFAVDPLRDRSRGAARTRSS